MESAFATIERDQRLQTGPFSTISHVSVAVYDSIRVLKEHLDATSPALAPEFPVWINPEATAGLIDLDGLNWDSLGDML
jgi:hypothetical protein